MPPQKIQVSEKRLGGGNQVLEKVISQKMEKIAPDDEEEEKGEQNVKGLDFIKDSKVRKEVKKTKKLWITKKR